MTGPGAVPLVYNPRAGAGGMALEALLARLPAAARERLRPVPLALPFDYRPVIDQARAARTSVFLLRLVRRL